MRLVAICALVVALVAGPVSAQDDRTTLQAFLEDNLSDAGREVRILGFTGALSGRASFEQLTIADEDGIWLRIGEAVFDWRRRLVAIPGMAFKCTLGLDNRFDAAGRYMCACCGAGGWPGQRAR